MIKYALAVDIGGSKLMCGIVDLGGNVLIKKKYSWDFPVDREGVVGRILNSVDDILTLYRGRIDGVGVAIPGLADYKRGLWVYSCFSGIGDIPLGRILESRLGVPVFLDNDVNVCALGEKMFGCCKDTDDFFWITVSNGIGGGMILDKNLYRGAFGHGGEIGHICVAQEGVKCSCGSYDCLEAHASGVSIGRRFNELTGKKMTAQAIASLARSNDKDAIKIFKQTGVYLGRGISYCINLLNLRKVIVGGGVAMSFDLFEDDMKRTARNMVYKRANEEYSIERTALSYDAALIGAAALAFKNLM